jgi:alpha,alpha-trehalase
MLCLFFFYKIQKTKSNQGRVRNNNQNGMADFNFSNIYPLFEDVQLSRVFPRRKNIFDCTPQRDLKEILSDYTKQKDKPGFDLKRICFNKILNYRLFLILGLKEVKTKLLLSILSRCGLCLPERPDAKKGSLLPLPYPYIVPGGRFGEIYYWDSYFHHAGLAGIWPCGYD